MWTKRLSTTWAAVKAFIFGRAPLRVLYYVLVVALLLLVWLFAKEGDVPFVYNDF
ncbi:hypothetical protein LJC32_06245 [Oscillospiraceae bacterium OttesenSCG-928-F05]|nr:hypothetical protein [Oscillospiraceae bacterium OttesenSCG-928-F05]